MNTHIFELGIAVVFVALAFFPRRPIAAWSRWLYFAIALFFAFQAVFGFVLDAHVVELSKDGHGIYARCMQLARGFILGCFFALFVSGNIVGQKISNNERIA